MNYSLVNKIQIVLVISLFCTIPVFAANMSTSSKETLKMKSSGTLTSISVWLGDVFSSDPFTSTIFSSITAVEVFPIRNDARITWAVSTLVEGRVYYDTKSPVRIASTTPSIDASAYGNYANSKATIRHLNASTTYYFKIVTEETSGEKSISKEYSFVTDNK